MTVVLDAPALLAYLQDEPGHEQVDAVLAEASMSMGRGNAEIGCCWR